jgi:hypothetical protein
MYPRFLIPVLACCLIAIVAACAAHAAPAPELKFVPLFNGRDLTGWQSASANPFWHVEAGELIGQNDAKKTGNMLWTEKSYGDFVLEFEVQWTGEIDSGVELREPKIQLQLGISRSLKRDMSGSFYISKAADPSRVGYPEAGQAKESALLLRPEGQWNTFRLEAKGPTFTVWINGQPAARFTDPLFSGPGPLGLQVHPGLAMKVAYRNIRVAVLP